MEKMIIVTMYLQINNLPLDWLTKQANRVHVISASVQGGSVDWKGRVRFAAQTL